MEINKRRDTLLLATLLLFLLVRPAKAYVDPGTGSMAIQVVVAAFLGFLYMLKRFWGSVLKVFSGGNKQLASQQAEPLNKDK